MRWIYSGAMVWNLQFLNSDTHRYLEIKCFYITPLFKSCLYISIISKMHVRLSITTVVHIELICLLLYLKAFTKLHRPLFITHRSHKHYKFKPDAPSPINYCQFLEMRLEFCQFPLENLCWFKFVIAISHKIVTFYFYFP